MSGVGEFAIIKKCKKKEAVVMCKRKHSRNQTFISAYFLFAAIVLMSLTASSRADGDPKGPSKKISTVPVKVNVLKGVNISDDEIKAILKGVNDALEKEGVNARVSVDPNINRNVEDTGNDDGAIQKGEEKKIDSNGRKELDRNFGQGKGIKLYFANRIEDSNSIRGSADARDTNSSIPKCIVYLKKVSDTNESKSNDAEHEILHILCLTRRTHG